MARPTLLYRSLFTLTAASIAGVIAFFGLGLTFLPVAGITLFAGSASYIAARLYSLFNQVETVVQRLNENTLPTIDHTFATAAEGVTEFIGITRAANATITQMSNRMVNGQASLFGNRGNRMQNMDLRQDIHPQPRSSSLFGNNNESYAPTVLSGLFGNNESHRTRARLFGEPAPHKPSKSVKNGTQPQEESSKKSSHKAKKK